MLRGWQRTFTVLVGLLVALGGATTSWSYSALDLAFPIYFGESVCMKERAFAVGKNEVYAYDNPSGDFDPTEITWEVGVEPSFALP